MRNLAILVCGLSFVADAHAQSKLALHPAAISLTGRGDRQRVIAVLTSPNGVTRDVTSEVRMSFDRNVARLEGGVAHPLADGKATLTATYTGSSDAAVAIRARAPVHVTGAKRAAPISFVNEVVPTLTRSGCNSGSCHGAASGKNGFRLSLFGYDKAADHVRLTRELRGRRIEPQNAAASLILRKPTTEVVHKGGKKLDRKSEHYSLLHDWIRDGARSDVGKAPALTGIEVGPSEAVLEGAGQRQRFHVRAKYADGTDRDVTHLALLSSMNTSAAKIDGNGRLTSGEPGEAFVMARFGTFAEMAQVLVLPKGRDLEWPKDAAAVNYIDEAIHAKLRKMRVAPAALCRDSEFVRRVYLDILNVLPSPKEAQRFLADRDPQKRAKLVDELLQRPEFPDVWAMQWAETLRIESRRLEVKGMHVYTNYLRRAFRDGIPFDRVVRELLTAKGGNFENPPSNFFLTERNPRQIAENVAQTFLGIRIQCAQCHNHPFERWTMDDYYGFAAFFARVATKRGEDPRERIVFTRGRGEVRNERTKRNADPQFLGGGKPKLGRNDDRRVPLAKWLTAPDNPWFAENVANRVFARFFGRGVVDPPDDVRVSNPPSHPRLLRALGQKLRGYGYDFRKLIRDITSSRTYQLARHAESPPAALFAGAQVRRMSAEQMLDAISEVCGVPTKYRGLPLGARATQVADGDRAGNRFLSLFGRPARTSACTCERRNEPTLGQVLHLINGPTTDRKIRSGNGRLQRALKGKREDRAILEDLWLAAYSRKPTKKETERFLAVAKDGNRREAWEDIYWAVLNSKEFLFNH